MSKTKLLSKKKDSENYKIVNQTVETIKYKYVGQKMAVQNRMDGEIQARIGNRWEAY